MSTTLGVEPVTLRVRIARNSPWRAAVLLRSYTYNNQPWPNAPLLTFEGGLQALAVLSEGRTRATFSLAVTDVLSLSAGDGVALHDPVTGVVYAAGHVDLVGGVPQ